MKKGDRLSITVMIFSILMMCLILCTAIRAQTTIIDTLNREIIHAWDGTLLIITFPDSLLHYFIRTKICTVYYPISPPLCDIYIHSFNEEIVFPKQDWGILHLNINRWTYMEECIPDTAPGPVPDTTSQILPGVAYETPTSRGVVDDFKSVPGRIEFRGILRLEIEGGYQIFIDQPAGGVTNLILGNVHTQEFKKPFDGTPMKYLFGDYDFTIHYDGPPGGFKVLLMKPDGTRRDIPASMLFHRTSEVPDPEPDDDEPPETPDDTDVEPNGDGTVTVSWIPNTSAGINRWFCIYYQQPHWGTWLQRPVGNVSSITMHPNSKGEWLYQVTAGNHAGSSTPSEVVSITLGP